MAQLLDVTGLSKAFDIHQLGRQIQVFAEVTFSLEPGQFLLVTGANGVGKSTLLRCLYRTYRPSSGRAWYRSKHGPIDLVTAADVDISLLRREEVGFVTQFLRPRPRVSALDLVAEPLLQVGHPWPEAQREASHWLEVFGLKPEIWPAFPSTFSGGEQQKVNLARALIAPRRLILLDEPTASLDAPTRTALVSRLTQLKQAGVAMIGVFHHPEVVRPLVDAEVHLQLSATLAALNGRESLYVAD